MRSTSPLFLASLAASALALAPPPAAAGDAPSKRTPDAARLAGDRALANDAVERARKAAQGALRGPAAVRPPAPAPAKAGRAAASDALLFGAPERGLVRGEAGGLVLVATDAGVRLDPLDGGIERPEMALSLALASVRAGATTLFERGTAGAL